jgi:hypothetical protein
MASPAEVKDNARVILDIVGGPQGKVDIAPAGEVDENSAKTQQPASGAAAGKNGHKEASSSGLTADELGVLAKIREVLQPVKDMTWPVGLTDNRK